MGILTGWAKRIKLTLDKDQIDAALSDFPVMIHLSAASGIGDVDVSAVFDELGSDANRKKIAVTSSDGTTELYVEIERWDDANEQAWLHVKIPSVANASDTDLYFYCDASHADNTAYVGDTGDAVTHNVWDSNFKAIYHMGQDPNGDVADAIKDSTSNAHDGTPDGSMVTADLVGGKVGKGIEFDGSNDVIKASASSDLSPEEGSFTVEAIGELSDVTTYRFLMSNREGSGDGEGIQLAVIETEGKPYFQIEDHGGAVTTAIASSDISDGVYRHIAGVRNTSSDNLSVYINGAVDGTPVTDGSTQTINSTTDLHIGKNVDIATQDYGWPGVLDEVRISDIARSAAWIKATYHSLWDSLITFGAEEDLSQSSEHNGVRSNFNKSSGKWYWETTIDSGATHYVGVATADTLLDSYAGGDEHAYSYHDLDGKKYTNGSGVAFGDAYAAGDVIGVALDLDNRKVFFSKNGAWQDSGDPGAGAGTAFTIASGIYYAIWSGYNEGEVTVNFGGTAFTYTPPTGFRSFGSGVSSIIWDPDHTGDGNCDPLVGRITANEYGDILTATTVDFPANPGDPMYNIWGSSIATLGRENDGKIYYFEVEVQIRRTGSWDCGGLPNPYVRVGLSSNALNVDNPLSSAYSVCRSVTPSFSYPDNPSEYTVRVGVQVDFSTQTAFISLDGFTYSSHDFSTISALNLFPAVTVGATSNNDTGYEYLAGIRSSAQIITENFAYTTFQGTAKSWADVFDDFDGDVSEGVTTSDEITASVEYGQPGSFIDAEISEEFSTHDDHLGTLPGESGDPQSGTVGEEFTMSDDMECDTPLREIGENVALSDDMECDTPYREADEGVRLSDGVSASGSEFNTTNSEDVEISAEILGGFLREGLNAEDVATADEFTVEKELAPVFHEEVFTVSDAMSATIEKDPATLFSEALIFDAIGWTWIQSPISTAAITDTVEVEVAISVKEYLACGETVETRWDGVEAVESTLGMFGNALIAQIFNEAVTSTAAAVDVVTYLHKMISAVTSTLEATDAALSKATFNPEIVESLAVAGLFSVLHTLNEAVTESVEAADAIGFSWLESITETGAIVDAATLQLTIMHILTDSLAATDAAVGLFNFTDEITDTLEIAAAVAVQQILQESVTDILNFGITLTLDGDLWECWVLNTNAFHPSVYSGFDFNSYAVYNNQAFGCREDGIYLLDGDTDDGSAFQSGVVLPKTNFGMSQQKRFRKAYFGLNGSSPAIRMETDNGSMTYNIVGSKANLSRSQKGKEWTVKVADWDDLDFIELVPIILTR